MAARNPDRDVEMMRLRTDGWTYHEIGAKYGIGASGAYRAVMRGLSVVPVEAAAELRIVENARLDELAVVALNILRKKHPVVSQGRLFADLEDDGPRLAAIDRLLKINDARRKMNGLDAPSRVAINVVTEDIIDAQIEALEAEEAGLKLLPGGHAG